MLKRISYPLSPKSPFYPGTPEISYAEGKSISKGDSANTTLITLPSHAGTHIDAPRHFCLGGRTTREMLEEVLILSPVHCIDLPTQPSTAIGIPDLEPLVKQIADAKGLLIRTGMFRFRETDPNRYCHEHPWIHPDLPAFLIASCPTLRLFGTDTISISNPRFNIEGRECHRAFLCCKTPVLLAEDLDLSEKALLSGPMILTLYPWLVDDLDGIPVHAFVEYP